jgi:hypothetical protein
VLPVEGVGAASAEELCAQAAPASDRDTPIMPSVFLLLPLLFELSDERAIGLLRPKKFRKNGSR